MRFPKHIDEIDFQRTILITLVILVHIVNFGNIHPQIKSEILAFLMPTFLLVTGYLVNINKTAKEYAIYLLRILLPYVILVTGYMVLSLYLPVRDGIKELNWETASYILCIHSIGPYWFFRVILICGFFYYATFRCLNQHSDLFKLLAFGIVLLAVSFLSPILDWKTAFYYFIGATIRVLSIDYNKLFSSSWLSVVPFLFILIVKPKLDWSNVLVVVLAFCFLSFATYIKRFVHGKPLEITLYVGRNTLPIYMFHPIFTMAGKFFLPAFQFDKTGILHAIVVVLLGIGGGICVGYVLDKLHLSIIFGKKKMLR